MLFNYVVPLTTIPGNILFLDKQEKKKESHFVSVAPDLIDDKKFSFELNSSTVQDQ